MRIPHIAFALIVGVAVDGTFAAAPQEPAPNMTLTAVEGIRVGHFTLSERPTGCTAILVDGNGAAAGVSQRGGAPGSRETNLLDTVHVVESVNALFLAGGSADGIDADQ